MATEIVPKTMGSPLKANTDESPKKPNSKGVPVKNLLLVSSSTMTLFSVSQSMDKLQSSVHFEDGLGTTALAVRNVVSVFASLIFAAPLIKGVGPKRVLLASMLGYAAYIAVNFKATWYTFIPVAALNGFATATFYASLWTYVGILGLQYSHATGLQQNVANVWFYGVCVMFMQSAGIWGNLISFEVLDRRSIFSDNQSSAACGAQFCDANVSEENKGFVGTPKNFYLLCGIFVGISILAMGLMSFVDNQKPSQNGCVSVRVRLVETVRKLQDPYMFLVFPITLYGGLQFSFITGDYTKAYTTCSYGVGKVGYVFICFGVVGTIFSPFSAHLVKLLGTKAVLVLSALLDTAVYFSLYFQGFRGFESLVPLFVLTGCFAITNSIWQVQLKALYCRLFADYQEVAFCLMGVFESLGISLGFVYSVSLCTQPKIFILFGLLLSGMICYGTAEFLLVRKQRSINISSTVGIRSN